MIKILDCTLRDGGYNNNWEFGSNNILKIFTRLVESNIDIIECGFLTQKGTYSNDYSLYDSIERITSFFNPNQTKCTTVCMINYGDFNIEDLPTRTQLDIEGIRVAFHKKDMLKALDFCKKIVEKGYKLFIQPMVSMSYTDQEFIDLIKLSNSIAPFAFYIVDSFGVMKNNDLMRYFYLLDNNLDKTICAGFHSHNNLQLSYSHAQTLSNLNSSRDIIIDSSVMGMGRGAGNLNTELYINYLNARFNCNYNSDPLLYIVDEILSPIYHHNYWGYSLPHYLSAIYNCHPNYATFLDDKNTLKVSDIKNILTQVLDEKKVNYDKEYIENLYLQYQSRKSSLTDHFNNLKSEILNKEVLLIAPGNSICIEKNEILEFISRKSQIITISINFTPEHFQCNYTFVSNLKRFDKIKEDLKKNIILTSNINDAPDYAYLVNYSDLVNDREPVKDNAGLMLIKLLIKLGSSKIYLAGFDGYSPGVYDNYSQKDLAFIKSESTMQSINEGISEILKEYKRLIDIEFLTKKHYVEI